MRTVIVGLALVFLVNCGKKPPVTVPTTVREVVTQEVFTPVPTPVPPPAELLQPLKLKPPKFISPSDPNASSALDAQGERDFRAFVEELAQWRESTLALWRALFPELFPK